METFLVEALNKDKKRSYDSDEDEANPLVIEEEDLSGQADDSLPEMDIKLDTDNSKSLTVSGDFFFS